jgi:hypothetical protein
LQPLACIRKTNALRAAGTEAYTIIIDLQHETASAAV